MKRIVHIIHCGTGGTGRLFLQLKKQDVHNQHLALAWGTEALSPMLQNEPDLVYIPKRTGVDLFAWLRILQELNTLKPDTVVLHSATAYPAVRIARMLRKMHWIAVEHTHPELQTGLEQKAMQSIACACDTLIVFSEERAATWRAQFPKISIAVIPHAIDTDLWTPAITEPTLVPFRIGVHGRVIPWKQMHLLIEALALLPHQYVHLHIAGSGSSVSELQVLAMQLNVHTQVHFHGDLNTRETLRFLQSLHAWMLPSKGESMGLAALEAIACGLPIALSGHLALVHLYPDQSDRSVAAWAAHMEDLRLHYAERKSYALALRKKLELECVQWSMAWEKQW